MMSGMPLETCSAFNERWNNKFYYRVASCWLFLLVHMNVNIEDGSQVPFRMGKICGSRGSTAVFKHHTSDNSCGILNNQETRMERRVS